VKSLKAVSEEGSYNEPGEQQQESIHSEPSHQPHLTQEIHEGDANIELDASGEEAEEYEPNAGHESGENEEPEAPA